MSEWWENAQARRFLRDARDNLAPKIEESAMGISIWDGKVDPKLAIETGYMILLDKPLIAFIRPGVPIPRKLALVVDRFIECEDPRDPKCQEALQQALRELGLDV